MEHIKKAAVPALLLVALVVGVGILPQVSSAVTPPHPLILIPTTLGTYPTGNSVELDPIANTYSNFIETFEANGYVENTTLFVYEYDWRESILDSADNLGSFVADILTQTGAAKVDIVAHGQGGIIAWQYTNNPGYIDEVEHLVFLGSPLRGAAGAYPSSQGGVFRLHPSGWGRGVGQALLDAYALDAGVSTYDYVLSDAPSFAQMLPIDDYLFNIGTSYPDGYPTNPLLENLWALSNLPVTGFETLVGLATGEHTPTGYDVTLPSSDPPRWPFGEPGEPFLFEGDGLTLYSSLENSIGINQSFAANHTVLPSEAAPYIFEYLTGEAPVTVVNESYPVACALFVHAQGDVDLQVVAPGGDRLGKNFEGGGDFDEIERSLYSGDSADTEYVVIANPEGVYQVLVGSDATNSFTIDSTLACGEEEMVVASDDINADTTPGEPTELELTIDGETVAIETPLPDDPTPEEQCALDGGVWNGTECEFPNPDTGAPVVTIHEPAAGQTYFSDTLLTASTTVTDPEGSAIASTLYLFNGEAVNPVDPLPFFDAPLGGATLEVGATDASGNTGSSTASFSIAAPPVEEDSYSLEFLPPISAKCYLHSKKGGVSKLWKHIFARLHLHYKFSGAFKRFIDCSDPAIFKAGSNIPVKFRVKNDEGQYVQVSGPVAWIEPIKGPSLKDDIEELEYTDQPSTGYFFDWKGSHYQYNWKTSRSDRGYWYNLFVILPDGSIHQTILGLR